MKVKGIKRLQVGGEMPAPAEQGAPAPEQGAAPAGGGPEEQLAQMAMQIVQQLGPEASLALSEMIVQVVQQAGGQAGAPQGEPQYAKRGGKLVMIGRR